MGSCVGKSSPVHPMTPRGLIRSLRASKGSHRIKVRMTKREFNELASHRSEAEIAQLVFEGCLTGRWQATSVGHACRETQLAMPRGLEPIKEEELG